MKKIAVFTSGGDAPGMNACIRAVTRSAIYNKLAVVGIMRGYEGMIDGDFIDLDAASVGNILQRGGTILKSSRSERFKTEEGRAKALENLRKQAIEGVVAIGGDGTFRGALEFSKTSKIPFVGIPGTIDNDLYGTDNTLGFDTASNTAMRAIDKIRDTADSHNRLFFIEVMGRDAGFIALNTGVATGAEAILIPETHTDTEKLIKHLENNHKRKKSFGIVIVAEGDEAGGAFSIAAKIKDRFDYYDIKVSILGHIQRGGSPSCNDRLLGSRLGVAAVEALISGKQNVMAGLRNNEVAYTPFEKATKHHIDINAGLLRIAEMLAI